MGNNTSWSIVPVVWLVFGVLTSSNAEAILDLKGYRLGKSAPEAKVVAENYVIGLRDGIVMFDAYRYKYEKVQERFCIKDAGLNTEKTIAILDLEIEDPTNGRPYPDDIPIVLIFIKAFERFAICK
jgi:hypothetical protein